MRGWEARKSISRAERVLKHFTLLGSSVGKALQDGRLMDIYLAPAFWDLMIAHVTKGAWSREVTPREVDPASVCSPGACS